MKTAVKATVVTGVVAGLVLSGVNPASARGKRDRQIEQLTKPSATASASVAAAHASGLSSEGTRVASTAEDKALRSAIKAANNVYKAAKKSAESTFKASTASAKSTRKAALRSAATNLQKLIAKQTYDATVAEFSAVRDQAIADAALVWQSSVDSAIATYDAATTSGDVLNARMAYRDSVKIAAANYVATIRTIQATYKAESDSARATAIAALTAATTEQEATGAWTTYQAAISAAKAKANTDRNSAQTIYRNLVQSAKDAYTAATGLPATPTPTLVQGLKIK